MKKRIIYLMILFMIFTSITGCSGSAQKASDAPADTEDVETSPVGTETLVAYFALSDGSDSSADSSTIESDAVNTSLEKDADLFKISPIDKYPDDPDERYELALEQIENEDYPELDNDIKDLDKYGTIYLIFPTWQGDLPPVICTFLSNESYSGYTIIANITGDGADTCLEHMRDLCPEAEISLP